MQDGEGWYRRAVNVGLNLVRIIIMYIMFIRNIVFNFRNTLAFSFHDHVLKKKISRYLRYILRRDVCYVMECKVTAYARRGVTLNLFNFIIRATRCND